MIQHPRERGVRQIEHLPFAGNLLGGHQGRLRIASAKQEGGRLSRTRANTFKSCEVTSPPSTDRQHHRAGRNLLAAGMPLGGPNRTVENGNCREAESLKWAFVSRMEHFQDVRQVGANLNGRSQHTSSPSRM